MPSSLPGRGPIDPSEVSQGATNMKKNPTFLVISLVLLGGALGVSLFGPQKKDRSGPSTPLVKKAPTPGPKAGSSEDVVPNRDSVSSGDAKGVSTLSFKVVGPGGGEASGDVYWVTSSRPPHCSRLMAPELGFRLSSGVKKKRHKGEGQIQIPGGHWTWMRVSGREKGTRGFQYRLVPPFQGTKELLFQLRPKKRRIHVFLLHDDLMRPVKGKEIRLFSRMGPKLSLLSTRKTNREGYVFLEADHPGDFLVLGPGVKPHDGPPFMTSLALRGESALNEIPITLVLKEPRITWNFEVDFKLPGSQGLPPKLFLKRLDGHLGELYPMPGMLRMGKNRFQFEVPRGHYELSALPLGRIAIPREFQYLDAKRDGQTTVLSLWTAGKQIPVKLKGLGYQDFPVTVYPRPLTPLLDDELKLMFCGPYRWHIPKNLAAFPRGVFDLLAFGRFKTWISKKRHSSKEANMEVQMVPACLVDVQLTGNLPLSVSKTVLFVRSEKGTFRRVMSRRLVPQGGAMVPAMIGRVVVPRGRVVLKIQAAGRELWKKVFQAKKEKRTFAIVR